MPSLTLAPDRVIWFAHCPKAGGTSIERMMVDTWGPAVGHLQWGWARWWHAGGWREARPPNSPQHLIWEDALHQMEVPPDAVFALVRAPLARLQSEQRYQAHHRRGTILGKYLARLPFSLWLRVMLAIAERNPYAFDNHLRAQADFVPDGARVFRLEDGMGAATRWLADVTQTPLPPPPHHLATGDHARTTRPDARDIALVARRFSLDHDRFGYALEKGDCPADPARPVLDLVARVLAPLLTLLERRGRL